MPHLPTAQPSTLFGKGIRWLMVAVASLMLISCGGGGSDAPLSSAKDITSFAFAKSNNASLAADVVGTVSGSAIAVTLPFGQSRTALVASFIALGVSVQVGERVQRSGLSTEDFSNPVNYVVTAADGSVKTYTVTVVNAHSSAKDITTFEFAAATNSSLATTIAGTITGEAIAVVLPYGVARAALVASFASTGQTVSVAGTPQNSASSVNNFEAPVLYTVAAQDGGTRSYTVTVGNAANSAKDITSFSVLGLAATITPGSGASTGTISLVLPYGVARSALVATFASTGKTVQVASQTQTSASTSNNFETPLTYTVTADDGSSKTYTVAVTNALNPAKSLTAFALGSTNATVSGNNVTLTLPYGTDRSALVVSFVSTGAVVKVGSTVQVSGSTANNFT
ncbi:MAG: hypothetical protein IPO43_05180 [Rhodoferax sp.]|nr:hypothetical protein [Rhodoferax sp.]